MRGRGKKGEEEDLSRWESKRGAALKMLEVFSEIAYACSLTKEG